MAVLDLVSACRRTLALLVRGLWACSLALLYLFVSLALCPGDYMARTAPSSDPQQPLGKVSTGPSPPTIKERPSDVPGPNLVGSDTPLVAYYNSRFSGRQPPVTDSLENVRPLTAPKIVVQDFSAEDRLTCCKSPEHDPTDTLKQRRRPSWSRVSASLEDHPAVTARPSPTRGAASVTGGEGLKHRRSDIFVQRFVGFPGGRRMVGDIVAKDGSFVIVGL